MKGGFGKFLTFILGLVVGVLLVGGTIAGVVYYAVAAVSVNDVEKYTKQEFTFIDKDAEIRNKSILDIYDMVKGGNIKETTVSDAKRIFGIDIIKILENSLEITVDDKSRETLGAMKVADVFKDNNLKVVLNCFTLGDVLKKTGIDTTTGLASKPIVQEHISEPVIDGFNALLKSLEINEMTIAEMQYLLGVSFGAGGVLDTVANVKIGDLNSAINNIKFEDVLPDFDRDFYAEWDKTGAVLYKKESGGEIKLKQLIEADGTSEFFKFVNTEAKDPAKTYYKLNREEGTIKVSDDGNWELIKELPDFNNRYDISGKRNRFGLAYVVLVDDNGIKITKRYADRDCTVENEDGMYYFKYTKDAAGTNYRYGAAIRTKIEGTDPAQYKEVIEWRGYVEATDGFVNTTPETYGYSSPAQYEKEELVKQETPDLIICALVHVGKSEPVLKALADETLNTLDGAIGDMKLGQVIEITDDSADILKKLKDSKISEIDKDVKNVKVGDIMKVVSVTTAEKATDGAYIALPALSAGKEYKGTFITAKDGDKDVYLVKYKDGLAGFGARYNITEKASNGVVVALADKTIGTLSTGVDEVVDGATLSDVLEIDGKVYVKATDFDAAVALSHEKIGQHVAYYKDGNLFLEAGYVRNNNGDYVYLDKEKDGTPVGDHIKFGTLYNEHGVAEANGAYFKYNGTLYKLSDYKRFKFDGETAAEYYACIYEGESDKILSKMATMTVKDLADNGTMDKIVKDMRIGDVMELNDKNSVLYGLGNSKISSIEAEVSDKIKVATLRELNTWGNLGLTEEELNKTVKGTTIKVGDMKAAEFLKLAIQFATNP